MQVGLLSPEQKDLLVGQQFDVDSYFNPMQDAEDNWIISQEEMQYCVVEQFSWVKELPLIEYHVKLEFD
jgi:hypothetical protein